MAMLPADCQPGRPVFVVLPCMFCSALLFLYALQGVSMHPSFIGWLKFSMAGVSLLQTMDMTLSQVYEALASSTVAAPTQPHSLSTIQEIVLPPVKSVVTAKRSMFTGLQKNIVN